MKIPIAEWDDAYSSGNIPWRKTPVNVEKWLELAEVSSGKALDLGCGTGDQAVKLSELGFEVEGLDYSPEAIIIAKSQQKTGVSFVQWDLENLVNYDFQHQKYDLMICRKVLAFLDNKEEFLKVVASKLSGTFILELILEHDEKQTIVTKKEEIIPLIEKYFTIVKQESIPTREGIVWIDYFLKAK